MCVAAPATFGAFFYDIILIWSYRSGEETICGMF